MGEVYLRTAKDGSTIDIGFIANG